MMNFNKSFRKNFANNKFKTHKKSGLHHLTRKHNLGKTTGEGGSILTPF